MVEEELDAWRCQLCRQLIYNIEWQDDKRIPVPGAPSAGFISKELHRICLLCAQMYEIVDNEYFQQIDREERERMEAFRRNFK